MSRSFRKHPMAKGPTSRFWKKESNRKTRLAEDVSNGSSYKKNHLTWNICDWHSDKTLKEFIDGEHRAPTAEEINEYEKRYKRK